MSGETNRLLKLVGEIHEDPNDREVDVIVSTGEQVSVGLVDRRDVSKIADPTIHRLSRSSSARNRATSRANSVHRIAIRC